MDSNMTAKAHLADEKSGDRLATQVVVVSDFDMPFGSMVAFMVKWAIASIPALIILWIICAVAFMILASLFGSIFHLPGRTY